MGRSLWSEAALSSRGSTTRGPWGACLSHRGRQGGPVVLLGRSPLGASLPSSSEAPCLPRDAAVCAVCDVAVSPLRSLLLLSPQDSQRGWEGRAGAPVGGFPGGGTLAAVGICRRGDLSSHLALMAVQRLLLEEGERELWALLGEAAGESGAAWGGEAVERGQRKAASVVCS